MSDTTWDECKCCRHDTDCIKGLYIECFEYGNKPITEHPDVQRLIIQVETWKDGVQYVGTCGTTLKEALKGVEK